MLLARCCDDIGIHWLALIDEHIWRCAVLCCAVQCCECGNCITIRMQRKSAAARAKAAHVVVVRFEPLLFDFVCSDPVETQLEVRIMMYEILEICTNTIHNQIPYSYTGCCGVSEFRVARCTSDIVRLCCVAFRLDGISSGVFVRRKYCTPMRNNSIPNAQPAAQLEFRGTVAPLRRSETPRWIYTN